MKTIPDSKIESQLVTILHDRYNIPLESLGPEHWDVPLTSEKIGMSGFVLAQLFFEIEKDYDKRFDASLLKNYGFCTINNIAKAILTSK